MVTFLYMFVFYLLRKCQYSIMIVTAASYLVISFVDNQPGLRLWVDYEDTTPFLWAF